MAHNDITRRERQVIIARMRDLVAIIFERIYNISFHCIRVVSSTVQKLASWSTYLIEVFVITCYLSCLRTIKKTYVPAWSMKSFLSLISDN